MYRLNLIFDLFCPLNKNLYLCISNNLNIKDMNTVIYTRVSSVGERQNTERQILDLSTYATKTNLDVVKVYEEHISGATKNANRNTLNECLSFAQENKIDIVLFSELSRLGRNVLEIIEVVKWFSDNKINAYFQKENLTLLNDNGEVSPTTTILISCLGMVAEIERENIKFRLNSGRELAKSKGVKMGRKVGSVENLNHKKQKYPIAMHCIQRGYTLIDTLNLCETRGEKVSLSTLKTLKKLIK